MEAGPHHGTREGASARPALIGGTQVVTLARPGGGSETEGPGTRSHLSDPKREWTRALTQFFLNLHVSLSLFRILEMFLLP